jgi:hypothetical protein
MLGGCGKPQAGSGQRKSRGGRRQQKREQDIEDDYFTDSDDEAEVGFVYNITLMMT